MRVGLKRRRVSDPATAATRPSSGLDGLRADRGQRKPQGEAGALPGLALELHVTAHHAREPAADRESEPRTAVRAREARVHLDEGLEDEVLLILRNADARIGHLVSHPLRLAAAVAPLERDGEADAA